MMQGGGKGKNRFMQASAQRASVETDCRLDAKQHKKSALSLVWRDESNFSLPPQSCVDSRKKSN